MRCPHCKTDGVYIGLQWIHCLNTECRYYDKQYADKVAVESLDALTAAYEDSFADKVERLIRLRGETKDSQDP